MALAVGVAAAPARVPGLTIPSHMQEMTDGLGGMDPGQTR